MKKNLRSQLRYSNNKTELKLKEMKNLKVLFITTSNDQLGNSGLKTGVWLEEVATPYYAFKSAGFNIDIASIKGGKIPIDPTSELPEWETKRTIQFKNDSIAMDHFNHSLKLNELHSENYDQVYFPGGHGPMWDFINNEELTYILNEFIVQDKTIGALCHGVAVLIDAKNSKGEPFIKGKEITSFSNSEEVAVGAQEIVPYLLETKLKELGGIYSKGDDFAPYINVDGNLVTGQNPASSADVALQMIDLVTD